MPKEKLENAIEEFVRKVTFSQEHIDNLVKAIETVWQSRQQEFDKGESMLDERISELQAQAFATVDKIKLLSSQTAIKYMEEELMEVEAEIAKLNEEKEQKQKEQPISFEVVIQYAKYFLQQIDPLKKLTFSALFSTKCQPTQKLLL